MQGDLFGPRPISPSPASSTQKMEFLTRTRVSLRFDQILVGAIGFLVLYVLIFSYGVERGKRFAFEELKAERAKRENMVQEFQEKLFSQNSETREAVPATPEKTASEPAPANASSEKKPTGKYTVQVITFKTKQAAEKEMKRITEQGHRGFVIPAGRFLQVCVDAFESRDQAVEALNELKAKEIASADAYVRTIPSGFSS